MPARETVHFLWLIKHEIMVLEDFARKGSWRSWFAEYSFGWTTSADVGVCIVVQCNCRITWPRPPVRRMMSWPAARLRSSQLTHPATDNLGIVAGNLQQKCNLLQFLCYMMPPLPFLYPPLWRMTFWYIVSFPMMTIFSIADLKNINKIFSIT